MILLVAKWSKVYDYKPQDLSLPGSKYFASADPIVRPFSVFFAVVFFGYSSFLHNSGADGLLSPFKDFDWGIKPHSALIMKRKFPLV